MVLSRQLKANLLLWIVPILWGITFPLMHVVLDYCLATVFVFWRFLLAGLLLSYVFILALKRRQLSQVDLIYGLLIGVTNCGAFVLQAIALETVVESSKVAFLTGVNVIMVPLLMPLFGMRKPNLHELIAALVCFCGIIVINNANLNFSAVDLLVLLSALCIALGILLVEKASLVSNNLWLLTFYQIIFTTIIPFGYLKGVVLPIPSEAIVWWALGYCALFATVIPIIIQLKFQKVVGSNKAAIIYSFEAVAAVFFAKLFFNEQVSINVIIGGFIIMFGAVYNDLIQIFKKNK